MSYQHQYVDGTRIHFPLGKVVCIGRNYAEHAKELDNPVPTEPLLFIKPGSCVVPLEGGFSIPTERGSVHYEAEIAVLIGKPLSTKPSREEVLDAISGFAPALDLTLRDKQAELKSKGLPWEIAKSFDGAAGDCSVRVRQHLCRPDRHRHPPDHQWRSAPGRQQQRNAQPDRADDPAHGRLLLVAGRGCDPHRHASGRRSAECR
ncbi:UNVERIFIED_ORG: 2-keto-4-pentenoate hydratase/2-oxohepta-3-ene-1,7-dioic acid hydratase in catechol pathway [Pseudomonas reinekei]|nr:2-keto-4-pentenoate hydratase/2-oxohepta-3-ene-1,7-dioic acid hydratase in catechol pathway [Pseudomonas reinekei]